MNHLVRTAVASGAILAFAGAAAPAMAGGNDDDDEARDPSIYIKDVDVSRYDVEVKVKYRCDTEHGDSKYGRIWVSFERGRADYDGYAYARCDDDWHYKWVDLDGDDKVRSGKAYVEAKIRDSDGDTDRDRDTVYLRSHHDHDHDHDDDHDDDDHDGHHGDHDDDDGH